MATFPSYPATSFEQAVDLAIFSSNQVGQVVNGDATTQVDTLNGPIPSLRKALVDNFYFKSPIDWQNGQSESVFNQLRFFDNGILSGYYYAPTATSTNSVPMGSTPSGDNNWVLYSIQQVVTPSEVYPFLLETASGDELIISPPYIFDSAIVTINGITQVPGVAYTVNDSKIILTEPLGVDPDTGAANTFFAYLGKVEQGISDYVQASALASPIGASLVGEVPSVAALRALLATKSNQKVVVKGYNDNSTIGGGTFYYQVDSVTPDDGGTFFRVSATGGWKRQINDYGDLDVTHFGAVPGSSDSAPAVKRMLAWSVASQDQSSRILIQFPAGTFSISTIDDSATYRGYFRLAGKSSSKFGYFNTTRLNLIGSQSSTAIKVQSRRTEISDITIYGNYDTDGVVRNFFENTVTAGSYMRGSNFQVAQMGGRTFSFMDSLDTKFDQFYTSYTYDNIFYVVPSGATSGAWDHNTAIELSNFNVQNHKGTTSLKCAFYIPLCTQALLTNGWIEHSTYPGNFSGGAWTLRNLSIESTDHPFYFQYGKAIEWATNFNGATSTIDYDNGASDVSSPFPSWSTSVYEQGRIRTRHYGTEIKGSLAVDYQNSMYRLTNMSSSATWYYVGSVTMGATGMSCKMRFVGTRGFDSASNTPSVVGTQYAGGEATVNIQNKASSTKTTVGWSGVNASPIQAVKYVQSGNNTTHIYAQMGPYTYAAAVLVETDGTSRYQAGLHFYWTPSISVVSDITTIEGALDAVSAISFNTGPNGNGFGMLGDGTMASKAKVTAGNATTGWRRMLAWKESGIDYFVPLQTISTSTELAYYSKATLPPANGSSRSIAWCTDTGATPTAQPVASNGTNWVLLKDMTTIVL